MSSPSGVINRALELIPFSFPDMFTLKLARKTAPIVVTHFWSSDICLRRKGHDGSLNKRGVRPCMPRCTLEHGYLEFYCYVIHVVKVSQ